MLSKVLAALILMYRNGIGLVLRPYRTMRSIVANVDGVQILLIIFAALIYQMLDRTPTVIYSAALFISLVAIISTTRKMRVDRWEIGQIVMAMVYTLIPTMIWFFVSLGLNAVLPPPRTSSVLGKILSLLYVAFSISILFWKIILTFLAIRFAGKFSFYISILMLAVYACAILTLIYTSLHSGWVSVPFI